jgi:hypothetical protein
MAKIQALPLSIGLLRDIFNHKVQRRKVGAIAAKVGYIVFDSYFFKE